MDQIIRIGIDTSKHVFQLHGVNAAEEPVLRKKLRRQDLVAFLTKLPPTMIGIEACGGSHHWARLLQALGHQVRMLPPQFVKPYVKRGKNDAADAEALCEAMSRPTMRFVPVKSPEQQSALMLVGLRDRLIRQRTQLANAIRGYATEFGLIAAKGMCRVEPLLERMKADETVPSLARELFEIQAREYTQLHEVVVTIAGQKHWLWRAVDQDGYVLDEIVQTRRDTEAAKHLLKRLLRKQGGPPRRLITDKLGSYAAAQRQIMPDVEHRSHKGINNRAENSHLPFRRRERVRQGFRSPRYLQRFVSVFSAVRNLFVPSHSSRPAPATRLHRLNAMAEWKAAAGVAT